MRRALAVAAGVVVLLAFCPAVGTGAVPWIWSGGTTTGPASDIPAGISCPAVSLCVMIDSSGDLVRVSTRPLATGSWRRLSTGLDPGNVGLDAVLCPSRGFCFILGGDSRPGERLWRLSDPGGPHPSLTPARTPGFDLPEGDRYGRSPADALDCPGASLCLIVTASGDLLATSAPADPRVSWRRVAMGTRRLRTVSCPSVSECFGFTMRGQPVVSAHPTDGPQGWRTINGSLPAGSLDCPTPTFCAASGSGFVAASTHPETGGWHRVASYVGDPEGIDCHANSICGKLDPNAVGPVLCPSGSLCVAFTNTADSLPLISTDPAGGRRFWTTRTPVSWRYTLAAGSCPTPGRCYLLDQSHEALLGLTEERPRSAPHPTAPYAPRPTAPTLAALVARRRGARPDRW